jgi:putative peptide zinc metalloprotease protein
VRRGRDCPYRGDGLMTTAPGPAGTTVRLRPLSVVTEGDDVLIGDPERGTFVAVPAVGGVVVQALLEGATVAEAGERASAFAGEPVDMADFITALNDLGFVADDEETAAPVPTAPVQQRGWTGGPPAALVRPLFSTAAWWVYGLAALAVAVCFVAQPGLWPRPADLLITGDIGTSLLIMLPVTYLLVGVHEMWHWLAARALNLQTRFGVDRRLFFLVFETDLSQLWSVPRRKRYGPQLAGLAIDLLLIAALLLAQLVAGPVKPLPALVFVLVASTLWQCMVFLRTDLYGVLVTATGCRNLWRVKSLLLRRAFGRLDERQRAELDRADPRDVRVGLWFRWIHLAGYLVAGAYFALFYLPLLTYVARWAADGIPAGPAGTRFWWGLIVAVMVYAPIGATLWITLARLRRRRA